MALECAGLNEADRQLKLSDLRAGLRYKNRNAWMKARIAEAARESREEEALLLAEETTQDECDRDAYAAEDKTARELDRARAAQLLAMGEPDADR